MSRRAGASDPAALALGVYEHVVTHQLARDLEASSATQRVDPIEDSDAQIALARHAGDVLARTLSGVSADRAHAITAELLARLATLVGDDDVLDQQVKPPPSRLMSLYRGAEPVRPTSPLATSTLLTRKRLDPTLGHELAREIATADEVDAIIAFVTVGGVRAIHDSLQHFARGAAPKLRLLTTTFTGTTEVAALDTFARLPGAEVRVSYDTRRTRLHAKAWLFRRNTGLTTAYIGSANLSATALGAGQEWMVKVCAADLPHVIEQFVGTFDTLWNEPEFEPYSPDDPAQRTRLQRALSAEDPAAPRDSFLVSLRALPFQDIILDKLAAERAVHGRRRNLVVAATGTGKTVIAALDYVRQVAANGGVPPRLLVLAHRRELLDQARKTFRHALQDPAFGELLIGNQTPTKWDHVFASIQAASGLVDRLGADYFRHVIVDECHHVPAKSYQDLVPRLRPALLVGLTATPERSDGKSLLPDFDHHIAAELRLWQALDDQLLVPFEYYGISDHVDLRRVRWSRTGYDAGALADLYTGDLARADLIRHQLVKRVADPRKIRALAFCVSIEHAKFMAARFSAGGIPALAVHGDSPDRDTAPARLRDRTVNVLFTADLYNEGVDLPFVDTLLLLRPTQSATLFLQQLGRGLRHNTPTGKSSCLVLDFIGQHRDEFRFDSTLSALTGIPRARLRSSLEAGFPFLPSGCALQLDAVAREQILASLRATLGGARRLTSELRELAAADAARPTLARFLDATGRDLDDVYNAGGWSTLQRSAGVADLAAGEDADDIADLSRRLGLLSHIDDPARLRNYREALARPASWTARDRCHLLMLESQLSNGGVLRTAEETSAYFQARPTIVRELHELCEVLEDRVALASQVLPVPAWSLALHCHYSRREILAAIDYVSSGDKLIKLQTGILKLEDDKRELLFVTLDKSGKSFSPTTRYRDYASSPALFHWETQANASVTRQGRRYVDPTNGWTFFLFVRTDPQSTFAFLGPITYQSHAGDRPIAITWRLATPMPAVLYERYATLRPG